MFCATSAEIGFAAVSTALRRRGGRYWEDDPETAFADALTDIAHAMRVAGFSEEQTEGQFALAPMNYRAEVIDERSTSPLG